MWGCAGSCKHYLSECEVPPSENNILMAVFLHPAVIHMHLLQTGIRCNQEQPFFVHLSQFNPFSSLRNELHGSKLLASNRVFLKPLMLLCFTPLGILKINFMYFDSGSWCNSLNCRD